MLSLHNSTNQITLTKTFELNEKMSFFCDRRFDDNRYQAWEILLERFWTSLIESKNRSQKIQRWADSKFLTCRDFVIKQSGHSNPFLLFRCTVLARTVSFMALLSMSQWIAHLICSRIFIAFIRIWNHLYECDKSKEFFYNTCQRLSVRTFPRSIDDVVQFLIVRYLRLFWKDNYWQETSRTQRRITY